MLKKTENSWTPSLIVNHSDQQNMILNLDLKLDHQVFYLHMWTSILKSSVVRIWSNFAGSVFWTVRSDCAMDGVCLRRSHVRSYCNKSVFTLNYKPVTLWFSDESIRFVKVGEISNLFPCTMYMYEWYWLWWFASSIIDCPLFIFLENDQSTHNTRRQFHCIQFILKSVQPYKNRDWANVWIIIIQQIQFNS